MGLADGTCHALATKPEQSAPYCPLCVHDGPPSSDSAVPHGMAARMLALVPMPSRRLSDVAVVRAMPPGASVAMPRPPSATPGSPSPSSAARPAQLVHSMHKAAPTLTP